MGELLATKGVTKKFGPLTAVNNVDFAAEEGRVTGVIGPNGSGKTTFFNLLSGYFPPTAGQIFYEGTDITGLTSHERVGRGISRSFQLVSIFPRLKVWENVVLSTLQTKDKKQKTGLNFYLRSASRPDIMEDCLAALKVVNLDKLAHQMAGELSYGDQRLLEIAIVLSLKPKVLLLDEPFAGLGDVEISFVLGVLEEIKKSLTLVIIDHKISKIIDLVERLYVLDRGSVICKGEPQDVINDPDVRKCYWGDAS
jgi:branched-chain amino acid transport system ATP-binding protein